MTEPRRSTRTRAREEAAPAAPETPKEPASSTPAKSSLKRKRTSTVAVKDPTPAPSVAEEPSQPTKPVLPIKLVEGQPLPTLPEPQPIQLPADDYQDIQQSGVLSASLQRSRAVWVSGTNFRLFHAFFTPPKRVADRTDEDKQSIQRQKEIIRNFPQVGNVEAKLVIEPHTFPIRLYGPREAAVRQVQKKPSLYGQWPNHNQYNQYNSYQQYNHPAPPPPPPNNYQKPVVQQQRPPPPKPAPKPPPPPAPTTTPAPDPVIHMLAQRAGTDPELKSVMKIVAAGQATKAQLEFFQGHINELTAILARQKEDAAKAPARPPPSAPPAPRTPSQQSATPQPPPQPVPQQQPPPPPPKPLPNPPQQPYAQQRPPQPSKQPTPPSIPQPPSQPQSQSQSQQQPPQQSQQQQQQTHSQQQPQAQSQAQSPQPPPPAPAQPNPPPQSQQPSQSQQQQHHYQPAQQPQQHPPQQQMHQQQQYQPPPQPYQQQRQHQQYQQHPPQNQYQHQYQQPNGPKSYSPAPQQGHPQQMPPHPHHQSPYNNSYNQNTYNQPQPYQHNQHNQHMSSYPQQPLKPTYRPLIFDFVEGNGDRFYLPSYSFLEWLPDHSGAKMSFLVTKMKPKPKEETKDNTPKTPAAKTTQPPASTPATSATGNSTPAPVPNTLGQNTPAQGTPVQGTPTQGTPQSATPNVAPVTPYVPPPRIEDFDEKKDIEDIELYQPVTVLILTQNQDIVQSLPRAVRPADTVGKYMDEVFDNCKRAEETYLAFRLPKEGTQDADGAEKRVRSGDGTPATATGTLDVVMGGMGPPTDRRKSSARSRRVAA